MGPLKLTFKHYVIACVSLMPALLLHAFRETLAASFATPPKVISGLGMLGSVLVAVGLSKLMFRNAPGYQWPIRPRQRLFAAAILVLGVVYFFSREEIARALNWRINFGDALATFIGLIAVMALLRALPPLATESDDADDNADHRGR